MFGICFHSVVAKSILLSKRPNDYVPLFHEANTSEFRNNKSSVTLIILHGDVIDSREVRRPNVCYELCAIVHVIM